MSAEPIVAPRDGTAGSTLRMTTEVDPYELVRVLQEMQQRIEHNQEDITALFGVLHDLSDVATEHLAVAQESTKDGVTIYW